MAIEIPTNTALYIPVGPFLDKADGITPELSITVANSAITLIAGASDETAPTVVLDSVAGNNATNTLVHITGDDAGMHYLKLTAANNNRYGKGMLIIEDTETYVTVFHEIQWVSVPYYNWKYGTTLPNVNVTQISGDSDAADYLEDVFDDATSIGNMKAFFDGTGYAGGTAKLQVDLTKVLGTALTETSAGYLAAALVKLLDVASPQLTAASKDQTGDSFDKVNDATIGLANLKALIDAMQADIGDASASTLGSLYAILGNATAAIAGRLPAALESGNMPVHVKAQDNIDFGALQKASITAAVPTASAIGTDAASKVLVTPAQKLVTDANGYVTYSNAAPPSADDVVAAMEANGSKLDHLWEMTEDDGGVRRLTTNALEQAPTGGSAPSAASIADAVWDEAIADHTTATTFGGKNQKGVPSETVNDYKATGFSTHTAADVKTAMEAVGSHLALIKTAAEAIDTLTKASGSGDLARALVILEKIYKSAATIVEGAAAVGTLSTTEMTTTLTEATDDHYNGRVIIFSSGVLTNQATDITDYDGATKKLTFTAVTEAPTAADTFVIV